MKLQFRAWLLLGILAGLLSIGCKPRSMSEKVQDKVEDTTHEVGQGIERAGDRVKDSAK